MADQISNHCRSEWSEGVTEMFKCLTREKRLEPQLAWVSSIGHMYSVFGAELGAKLIHYFL